MKRIKVYPDKKEIHVMNDKGEVEEVYLYDTTDPRILQIFYLAEELNEIKAILKEILAKLEKFSKGITI